MPAGLYIIIFVMLFFQVISYKIPPYFVAKVKVIKEICKIKLCHFPILLHKQRDKGKSFFQNNKLLRYKSNNCDR